MWFSRGIDQIPIKLVKDNLSQLVKVLVYIYNLCLNVEYFYVNNQYNKTKKGEISKPALLPQYAKILEKIMCNRLSEFLETEYILSNANMNSDPNILLALQVMDLRIFFLENMKKMKCFITASAFDMVNHRFYLNKLESLGIRELPLC